MLTTADSAKRIYLDYAATTPTDKAVLEVMWPYFDRKYGNPSSLHTSGREALLAIATARQKVASVLNARPEEIIFTGSGTEADNLAIVGVAKANQKYGKHIIVSAIEHKAVLEAAESLVDEGFDVTLAPVNNEGLIDVSQVLSLIRPDTILISVMYANNEVGTVEPIAELTKAIKEKRGNGQFPLLHTDACQAAGYLTLDVDVLGVDLMTINSSKIYGPKGVGALYKRKGVKLKPVIVGGEQEENYRAGTESVPLIMGFAEALVRAETRREDEVLRLTKLRDYFMTELVSKIPNATINGHKSSRLPNNVHVSVPYIEGESMLLMLDDRGIEVGTGSACSARDLRPSHVLLALGQDAELMHGSIRFSMGKDTTKDEIDEVLSVFPQVVSYLTNISALTTTVV